mgnify:CR=1 FL=1
MIIKKVSDGVYLLKNFVHKDNRGYLKKFYNSSKILNLNFKQFFITENKKKGTIRAFHYQKYPYFETKIVSVIKGEIFDVIFDTRKNSKNRYKKKTFTLRDKDNTSLLIGPGYAHGYQTLKKDTIISYLVSPIYKPDLQTGIIFNDPKINVRWPIKEKILSKRDLKFKRI